MAKTFIPLEKIDIPPHMKYMKGEMRKIEGMVAAAETLMNMIPGIDKVGKGIQKEIKKRFKKEVKKKKKELYKKVKDACMEWILEGDYDVTVNDINIKIIQPMNESIRNINNNLSIIKSTIAPPIFATMAVAQVVFIVAKIITLLPSFGFGVVVTSHVGLANTIASGAQSAYKKIKPLPIVLLAVYNYLLETYLVYKALYEFLNAFLKTQAALAEAAASSYDKTEEDWGDTGSVVDGEEMPFLSPPSGVDLMEELANEDENSIKIARNSNLDIRVGLANQINSLEGQLVSCTLPDGSVEQLSPEACLAAGGTSDDGGIQDLLYGLRLELDKLGGSPSGRELKESYTDEELNDLENKFNELNKNLITSLLYIDEDVTIEKATARKGKRYGFYQTDIKQ